jgi:hypothetical protein
MNVREIRRFKVDLLDEIHELAHDPLADLAAARRKVEEFFSRLEDKSGEKR